MTREEEIIGDVYKEMMETTARMKGFIRTLETLQREIEGDMRALDEMVAICEKHITRHRRAELGLDGMRLAKARVEREMEEGA